MIKINLEKIDVLKKDDQEFLYEVLKFRWGKADMINTKYKVSPELPTFEEHLNFIKSNKFKAFYKTKLGDLTIGMISIDNDNVNSTFVMPNLLKNALKHYKNEDLEIRHKPIALLMHTRLYEKHPEVTIHFARVNPKNEHSLKSLIRHGYEEIEIILALKTKNGKIAQGPWAEADDDSTF